jgi:hypothetical protein
MYELREVDNVVDKMYHMHIRKTHPLNEKTQPRMIDASERQVGEEKERGIDSREKKKYTQESLSTCR